jgi:hypothetical protein
LALLLALVGSTASCGGRQVGEDPRPQGAGAVDSAAPPAAGDSQPSLEPGHVPIPPLGVIELVAEPLPVEPKREIRLCAGGDVTLGTNLDTSWAGRASARLGYRVEAFPDPDRLLAPLKPLVADADVVLLNIEGAIGEGAAPPKCRPGSTRCYAFRQPIVTAGALRAVSYDAAVVGNVANNHALDAGDSGLAATMGHLEDADVYVTGADTLPTIVLTELRDTVAVLGFSSAQAGPDPRDLEAVRRHVARAAARYGRVVVTMHMGAEGTRAQRTPNRSEQFLGENRGNSVAFAHTAVDAGASVVIGHGPHVMRAAEWRGDALILYSLGNLLTYGPFSFAEPLNKGGIACVDLDHRGRVSGAVLRSTNQRAPGHAEPDPRGRAAWLVDSLSRLDFPETGARLAGEARVRR